MSSEKNTMAFTGERFTPECVREMAYEHWHRYGWALDWVKDKVVLDVACGEGYGAHCLAKVAESVTGIDADAKAIEHATARYVRPNLVFKQGDALALPIETSSVDVVVSFETIEHLEDHEGLMAEFKRVLRPEGCVILSSPNKAAYSDDSGYDNPFHVKELYQQDLEALLARHFGSYQLLAQKLTFASVIWPWQASSSEQLPPHWLTLKDEDIDSQAGPLHGLQYFLAVAFAGEAPIELPTLSLFSDAEESVYQHYHEEIRHHITTAEVLAQKDQEIANLKAKLNQSWWLRLWAHLFR